MDKAIQHEIASFLLHKCVPFQLCHQIFNNKNHLWGKELSGTTFIRAYSLIMTRHTSHFVQGFSWARPWSLRTARQGFWKVTGGEIPLTVKRNVMYLHNQGGSDIFCSNWGFVNNNQRRRNSSVIIFVVARSRRTDLQETRTTTWRENPEIKVETP